MSERTFVVIFFFWAALTIVTPTLILLSESSTPDHLHFNVDKSAEMLNARKMMVYAEKQLRAKIIPSSTVIEAPTPAPASAPAPEPVWRTRLSNLRRIFKKK